MGNKAIKSLPALAAVFLAACGTHEQPAVPTIHIDLASASVAEVDTTRMLRLEAGDSSMLFGIDRLMACDSVYVVHSRNYLRAFDRRTGRFMNNVASYGTGPADFSNVSMLWQEGDTILLFDSNRRTVAKYLPDGTFLGATQPFKNTVIPENQPLRQFYRLKDGQYISVNGSTGGSTDSNPLVSLYGADMAYIDAVKGRDVAESTYLTDGTWYDTRHDRVLMWEPMRDTIFAADASAVAPLYAVDWGAHSLPDTISSLHSLAERLRAFSPPDAPLYASFIQSVRTDGDGLYFSFADNRGRSYIVRSDAQGQACAVRSFASADGRYTQGAYFMLDGDSLRVALRDNERVEANPIIYTIAKNDF